MGAFFSYSLQSALCLAIFYLFYTVVLSRETFHRLNRCMLLFIMALSWIIPLFAGALSFRTGVEVVPEMLVEQPLATLTAGGAAASLDLSVWQSVFVPVFTLYLVGIAYCVLYQALSYLRLWRLLSKGKHAALDNDIRLILHTDTSMAPFSWMKYIVLSEDDYAEDGAAIIAHETAHIRLRHSWDLMAAHVFVILQWFNPFAWLLYRNLRNTHEYEADKSVLDEGFEAQHYQLLLIKKAVGTRLYSMANGYNHSNNLKKRITMMLQKKSNAWARLKYALVLPLAATTVVAFARPEISRPFDEISSVKVSYFAPTAQPVEAKSVEKVVVPPRQEVATPVETVAETPPAPRETKAPAAKPKPAPTTPEDTVVFMVVEQMPEFPGGMSAMMKYLAQNIKYPVKAIEKKMEGRVVVSFVVSCDGSLRDFQVVRSVDPELDAEAIRVIKSMPNWKPGKQRGKNVSVKYTLPINFSLSAKKDSLQTK